MERPLCYCGGILSRPRRCEGSIRRTADPSRLRSRALTYGQSSRSSDGRVSSLRSHGQTQGESEQDAHADDGRGRADRCLGMQGQAGHEVPHYALAAHETVPFGRKPHCRAPRCIRCAQIGNGLPCLAAAHRQARSGMSQCSDCAPLVIAGQDATVRQRAIRGSAEVCPGLMYEWSLVSD